ncbi:Transcription factor jumonji/aspartyl beta-hydroxylase [Macrophomina phaseolina MS6]|uniref:[histone H3]-trimethyl-L-lysine(9) demethylase n=1 Tax=Macrophomina phaseolina (strain MS6) TaxID=1126212 RepID=K2RAX0_MACPH|nr:Transcription factor jumonji/aspartyl beta-hydroxylase [Macrophomina phaseolina MS6]
MDQFRSFKKFIDKIDKYGMKSGIVKVIPPQEWRDSLPNLDEAVKKIKVKNPITQDFSGSRGQYSQQNVEKQRSYNLPEWKALTQQWEHRPPAKRGERRGDQAPPTRTRATRNRESSGTATPAEPGVKRARGRPRKNPAKEVKKERDESTHVIESVEVQPEVPPTPSSPPEEASAVNKKVASLQKEAGEETPKPRGRQPKSISSRRKHNRGEQADDVDESAFENFNYRLEGVEEFTPERCAELEQNYWKTINFGQPLYGADMPGSLFDESTTSWNVAKLENLLDVLGTKVPGVNTAYLYLGMWKATFAWHLEDVDLYSINYIHFGAPKQWYSISQEDARKFENAMRSVWPNDAKNCSQFLRHKTYLISPQRLESEFGIKVNKLVHYEGEFVLTYPYGYHSGYNIGYNCAESVNFATEAWLEYGRIAKKCDCESDSVWVDVAEIERKLRGEPTPEYIEETDDEDDEEDIEETGHDLPSPPASVKGKPKTARKRKRETGEKASEGKVKRVKLRLRVPKEEPCVLCPNDVAFDVLLPTDNGQKAHRLCALYTPETFIVEENGVERICNVANIDKARLELKCNYCRSKRGACFQCASKKCIRAFHATCAAAAGVQIDEGPVPTFDEDGTEYYCDGFDLRCRFHRAKRPRHADVDSLENNKLITEYAKNLDSKQVVQAQYLAGEIFAGIVVENKPEELSVVIDVLPHCLERVEVEWKYLLVLDPAQSLRPKPSANAKPLPEHLNQNSSTLNAKNQKDGPPEMDTPFCDANNEFKWAEFHTATVAEVKNPFQTKIDLAKPLQLWHYLGKTSTEARAQYTDDLKKQQHNPKSHFLDTVKPPPKPPQTYDRRVIPGYPSGANINALNGAMAAQRRSLQPQYTSAKPYEYKPRSGPGFASHPHEQRLQNTYHNPYPYGSQPSSRNGPAPYPAHLPPYPYGASPYSDSRRPSVGPSHSPPSQHPNYVPPYHQTSSQSPYGGGYHDPRTGQPVHYPNYHRPSFPYQQPPQPAAASPPLVISAGSATSMSPSAQSSSPAVRSDSISSNSTQPDLEYLQWLRKFPYLRNAYLRRPKVYESPYPGTSGFSEMYNPRKIMAERQAQRFPGHQQPQWGYAGPASQSGSYPHNYPHVLAQPQAHGSRPSLMFQSAHDFQADVNKTQASQMNNMPKFDMLIKQLSQANENAARRFAAQTQAQQGPQQQQPAPAPQPPNQQQPHGQQACLPLNTSLGGYTGPSNTRGYKPGYGLVFRRQ